MWGKKLTELQEEIDEFSGVDRDINTIKKWRDPADRESVKT